MLLTSCLVIMIRNKKSIMSQNGFRVSQNNFSKIHSKCYPITRRIKDGSYTRTQSYEFVNQFLNILSVVRSRRSRIVKV